MSDETLRKAVHDYLWSVPDSRKDALAALMKAYDEAPAPAPTVDAALRERVTPFERGRSQDDIREDITRETGEDYPLLGLIAELMGAVERDLRAALRASAPGDEG